MRIKAKFSFFAVLGFVLCTDREHTAVMCLIACFMHELGHIAAMLKEKRMPSQITFYGGGIHISDGGNSSISVLTGGCAANLLLFAVFYFFLPYNYEIRLFGVINLILAVFNLLPIDGLDGKGILERILIRTTSPEKAVKALAIAEKVTLFLIIPIVLMFILSGVMSFSAFIFFFYLIAVDIFDKI